MDKIPSLKYLHGSSDIQSESIFSSSLPGNSTESVDKDPGEWDEVTKRVEEKMSTWMFVVDFQVMYGFGEVIVKMIVVNCNDSDGFETISDYCIWGSIDSRIHHSQVCWKSLELMACRQDAGILSQTLTSLAQAVW